MPPVATAASCPSVPPLQLTFVGVTDVTVIAVGCVTVPLAVAVQLFASLTVTVYVPAAKPVRGFVPVPAPLHV